MDHPGILNRMKHIPTRSSLFINANYMRRREERREGEPRGCVPAPVPVICYLHLYTFFSFNKRRPGFPVTFMDSLFQKNDAVTVIVCRGRAPGRPHAGLRGLAHGCRRPASTRSPEPSGRPRVTETPVGAATGHPGPSAHPWRRSRKHCHFNFFKPRRNHNGYALVKATWTVRVSMPARASR